MATRYSTISRCTITLFKSSLPKPSSATSSSSLPKPAFSFHTASQPYSIFSRPLCEVAMLQSMLPLHSAVSSSRLTSCLGIDSKGSRSLSQEIGLSVPR